MLLVKVYRVFTSIYKYRVFALELQFHRGSVGDSRKVVTSFMHVRIYLTRYFATLGQLWLLPPFNSTSIGNVNFRFSS